MVMSKNCRFAAYSLSDPKGPPQGVQAGGCGKWSAGFREHHLTHVDISGQESGFAIGEVVFPQAPEAVVEARRHQVRPGRAEIASPDRERLGIILPENALADDGNAEPFAERLEDLRRGPHAAGENIVLDEI